MKTLFSIIFFSVYSIFLLAQSGNAVLGIATHILYPDDADQRGFDQAYGSLVRTVFPETGAQLAGLQPFDYIVGIADRQLNEDQSLSEVLTGYQPGQVVTIDFYRKGKLQTTNLLLSDNEEVKREHPSSENDPLLGISASHAEAKDPFNYGVVVRPIHNSTAEAIGINDDATILEIDGIRMYTWSDLTAAIDNRKIGDPIEVTYWQEGQSVTRSRPIKSRAATHNDHSRPKGPKIITAKEPDAPVSNARMETVSNIPVISAIPASNPVETKSQNEQTMPLSLEMSSEPVFQELSVFPNPSDGLFNIQFTLPNQGNTIVRVFDSRGAQVYLNTLGLFSGTFSDRIDIANNVKGIYFLSIQQDDQQISRKLILQ